LRDRRAGFERIRVDTDPHKDLRFLGGPGVDDDQMRGLL